MPRIALTSRVCLRPLWSRTVIAEQPRLAAPRRRCIGFETYADSRGIAVDPPLARLDRKETLKKGAISGEPYSQLLSGNSLGRVPLFLEVASLLRKALRQPLHQLCHQLIRLFYGRARLVNETRLNIAP